MFVKKLKLEIVEKINELYKIKINDEKYLMEVKK